MDIAPVHSFSFLRVWEHSSARDEIMLDIISKSLVSFFSEVERIIDFLVLFLFMSMQDISFSSSIVFMAFTPSFLEIKFIISLFDLAFARSRAVFMLISFRNFE